MIDAKSTTVASTLSTDVARMAATIQAMETLGDRLRALRSQRGDTQLLLANIAGVTKQAISKIERAGVIESASSTLEPIARHYGVSLRWLLTGQGPSTEETAPRSHSYPLRLDPEIVRDIAEAMQERYKLMGGFDLAERANEFVRAYELWTGMSDASSEPSTLKLVIRHADLSPQGAIQDGQASKKASAVDDARPGVRPSGARRKA